MDAPFSFQGLWGTFAAFYFQRLKFTHPCRASRLTCCAALRECIPAGFSSHTQSGRRSACRTSCGWCFCRSSSADRDSTSRSSSWACFSSCPICVPPTGQRDRGQDHERDSLACATVLLSYLQWWCQCIEIVSDTTRERAIVGFQLINGTVWFVCEEQQTATHLLFYICIYPTSIHIHVSHIQYI